MLQTQDLVHYFLHHIYNFGNVSRFMGMGGVQKEAFVEPDGRTRMRRWMPLGITADERVCSGAHYAAFFNDAIRLMNNPEELQQSWKGLYEKKAWADQRPQYRDKTWDFNIDEKMHRDGVYYYFTRCPLNNFARKYGYLEILPACCELDYLITEANHAVLHRDQTLASGGTMCDYWVVPDKIKDPR